MNEEKIKNINFEKLNFNNKKHYLTLYYSVNINILRSLGFEDFYINDIMKENSIYYIKELQNILEE